ncbi:MULTISPECIES: helix-turn-helix domain-containing protein [unclassified Synechococcus]|uniref:helix-turn-helix domain-containing protein n=1 Tax=Synechococcus sp. CCFWC 502 TaxID=2978474 RepID=UPI0009039128|nr:MULTISPECIES: helix-turn-helix domain-containing protein [unclassified Synechococcus]WFN59285.1 helix-turn-helix domain-containing protein [Synechococcus sp. CCFWC 502]
MAPLHRFEAVEQLETQLQEAGLDVRLLQLSNGRLSGSLVIRRLGPLRLLRLQANRCLHVAGSKPLDQRLVCLNLPPSGGGAPLRAHGTTIGPDVLFGLDPRAEVHLSTPEQMDLAVVMLTPSTLTRWSSGQGDRDLEAAPFRCNCLPIDVDSRTQLQRWLLKLLPLQAETPSVPVVSPSAPEAAGGGLLPLLVDALEQGLRLRGVTDSPPARIQMVKQLQQWVEEHPLEPISLDGLCRQAYVGRRSLILGFKEHLGMGPMAYFKLQRLHGVRRGLLEAAPGAVTISGLAASWGFLNPGHFARDYRRLFGELPSATLSGRFSPAVLARGHGTAVDRLPLGSC